MIDLTYLPSIFPPLRRRRFYVNTWQPHTGRKLIEETIGEDPDACNWLVIREGKRVELEEEIQPGQGVTIIRAPADPISILITVLITTAISFGLNLLIGALFGTTSQETSADAAESPTYTFAGIQNRRTQGGQVAVIFGEHRIGGQILMQYRATSEGAPSAGPNSGETTQYLYMLLGLGVGQLQSVGIKDTIVATDDDDDAEEVQHYRDDQDGLTSSGLEAFDGFSELEDGDDLADDPAGRWERIDGQNASIEGHDTGLSGVRYIRTDALQPQGASYRYVDPIGLGHDNIRVVGRFLNSVGAQHLGLAINLQDRDNYHAVRCTNLSTGAGELYKWVAGVRTVLATWSSAASHASGGIQLKLQRVDENLKVRDANDTVLATATADSALASRNFGVAKNGGTGTASYMDDFRARSARGLPGGLHINGNLADNYKGVAAWLRIGKASNAELPSAFSKVIQAYRTDLLLLNEWTEYQFRSSVQGVHVVLDFPQGLYDSSGGSLAPERVRVDVEYSSDGGATWTAINGSPFAFEHTLTSAFSRTIIVSSGLAAGDDQRLRVRRRDAIRYTNNELIKDEVRLGDINEIQDTTTQTYDGLALLALKIEAQENLQGQVPRVTVPVRGVAVPTWDGTGDAEAPDIKYKWSANPAWCALHILLDKRHGLGNWVKPTDIDWQSWYDWAAWCDEELTYAEAFDEPLFVSRATEAATADDTSVVIDGDESQFAVGDHVRVELERVNEITGETDLGGGRTQLDLLFPVAGNYGPNWALSKVELGEVVTDTRAEFHGVFDSDVTVWDALLRVCRVGRGVPLKEGAKWRVRWEDTRAVDQHISETSIVRDSLEISYFGRGDRPDIIEAQFLDKAQDYDQNVAVADAYPTPGATLVPKRETINLFGVTSLRQARREANYELRAKKLLQKRIEFDLAVDGLASQSGDVIRLALTMPDWSVYTGRASGTTDSFVIEQPLTLGSQTYTVWIRNGNDRDATQHTITSAPGSYVRGDTLTTDAGSEPLTQDCVVSIGTAQSAPTLWRLIKTGLNPDKLTVHVEGIQYDPDVYLLPGFPGGAVVTVPDAGACVYPGNTYKFPFSALDPVPPFCEQPATCGDSGDTCCFFGECLVSIKVDGAEDPDCAYIVEELEDGIIFRIEEGCATGVDVCVTIDCDGYWLEFPAACATTCTEAGDNQCVGAWQGNCNPDPVETCWTICEQAAFDAGYDIGFEIETPDEPSGFSSGFSSGFGGPNAVLDPGT